MAGGISTLSFLMHPPIPGFPFYGAVGGNNSVLRVLGPEHGCSFYHLSNHRAQETAVYLLLVFYRSHRYIDV